MTLYQSMTLMCRFPDQLYRADLSPRYLPYKAWRDTYPSREPMRFFNEQMGKDVWDPRGSVCPRYSDHLIQLVYRCLDPDVRKRPTPKELYKETYEVMKDIEAMCPHEEGFRPRDVLFSPNKYPMNQLVLNDNDEPTPRLPIFR